MATTKVDICARALVMIGASPISSFSDGSTEALVASNVYEDIVQSLLQDIDGNLQLIKNKCLY